MNDFKKTYFSTLIITSVFLFSDITIAGTVDHSKLKLDEQPETNTSDASQPKLEPAKPANPPKAERAVDPGAVVIDMTKTAPPTEPSKSTGLPPTAVSFGRDENGVGVADKNAKLKEQVAEDAKKAGTQLTGQTIDNVSKGKVEDASKLSMTKYDDNCRGAQFRKGKDKKGEFLAQVGTGKIIRGKSDSSSFADPKQLFQATASGEQRGIDSITPGQSGKTNVFRLDQPATLRDIGATEKNYTYYASTAPNIGMGKGILDAQLTAWGLDENGCLIWGGGGGKGMDGTGGGEQPK